MAESSVFYLLFGVLASVELLAYHRYYWLTVYTVRIELYVMGELASAPAAYWEASGSALGEVLLESFLGDFAGKLLGGVVLGKLTGE